MKFITCFAHAPLFKNIHVVIDQDDDIKRENIRTQLEEHNHHQKMNNELIKIKQR